MRSVTELVQAAVEWTQERVELIKRSVCPKGIPDDEFLLFIEQCKRSGLDPLLKEAFCVPRRFNAGTREQPRWTTRYEFQPSEAGMLARAERFPDYRGIRSGCVYGGDTIRIHQGRSEVDHEFDPTKREGGIVGAWAVVLREGRSFPVAWVDFASYVQETPLWKKMPATMIEKCARVAALRKAYPSAFGGLYIKEEMPEDEEPAPKPASRVEQMREEMKVKGLIVDVQAGESEEAARTRQAALPAPALEPTLIFGDKSGTPLSALTFEELSGSIDWATQQLQLKPAARNAPKLANNLRQLEDELERREAESAMPTQQTEMEVGAP